MSKIFISHSSANNASALAVGEWLKEAGWTEFFLDITPSRGLLPGERWQEALKAAADRCQVVLFLISPAWQASRWCQAEFLLAKQLGKTIFGVLIEPTPLNQLQPEMVAEWQLCDLTSGLARRDFHVSQEPVVPEMVVSLSEDGLLRLRMGLLRAGLDPSSFPWPPKDDRYRAPYRGLRTMELEDAAIFFGREAATVRGLDAIRGVCERGIESVFLILGASGAGKSSFLRAGLLPRLLRDDQHFLPLPVIRPEQAVISGATGVAASLEAVGRKYGVSRSRASIRHELRTAAGLDRLLRELGELASARVGSSDKAPTLVIPIDQGEELFGEEGEQEAGQLLDLLGHVLSRKRGDQRPSVIAIIAIRSDAYERLQTAPQLAQLSPYLFSLPPIVSAEYKAVIEGPARRQSEAGQKLTVDPALSESLVGGATGADALPLLAFTLERLFLEHGGAGTLTLAQYESLGGMRGSIEAAVDSAFAEPGRQPAVPPTRAERERLLRAGFIPWLARVDPDNGEPKRRVARWDEIPEPARPLLERLIEQRLLVLDRPKFDDREDRVVVEVAHEALLRQWPVLTTWLQEDGEALTMLDGVQRAVAEHARHQHDVRGGEAWLVHTGERLAAAQGLRLRADFARILGAEGQSYLDACQARADRLHREEEARADAERRALERELEQAKALAEVQRHRADEQTTARTRQRRFASLLGVLLVVSVAVGLYGWKQRRVAEQEQRHAESGKLAADALNSLAIDPERSLLLALEAAALGDSSQNALSAEVQEALNRALHESHARLRLVGGLRFSHVEYSPDGRVIAGAYAGGVKFWDSATGRLLPLQLTDVGKVVGLAFTPDGKRLITGGSADANVWDLATGRRLSTLRGHTNLIWSVAISADGSRVATASHDGTAKIWDLETAKELATLSGHQKGVRALAFAKGDKRLITCGLDGRAIVWDALSSRMLRDIPVGDPVAGITLNADKTQFATVETGATAVKVWDATSGRELFRMDGHTSSVMAVAYSRDGKRLATASLDKTVRIWDVDSRKELYVLRGHLDSVLTVSFGPDATHVVSGSEDGTTIVWDLADASEIVSLRGHSGETGQVAFSADGKWIASASEDATARVWDAHSGEERRVFDTHRAALGALAFSPDGTRLATAGADNAVSVFDVTSGRELMALRGHKDTVNAVAFSRDGRLLASGSSDKTAKVWDGTSGKELAVFDINAGKVQGVEFSPDAKKLAISIAVDHSDSGNAGQVWDLRSHDLLRVLDGDALSVSRITFSPDGARIATAGTAPPYAAKIWNAATGEPLMSLLGHKNSILSLAFSHDGNRLVTGGYYSEAKLWDTTSGRMLFDLPGLPGVVWGVAYSPDGKRVAIAGSDWLVRVRSVDVDEVRRLALSRRLTRTLTSEECRRYLSANSCSERATSLFVKAKGLLRDGNLEAARSTFRLAAARYEPPDADSEAKQLLSSLMMAEGRERAATADLEGTTESFRKAHEWAATNAEDPRREAAMKVSRAKVEEASVLRDRRQSREAIDKLHAALALDPSSERAQVELGFAYDDLDRHEEAVVTLRRLVDARPTPMNMSYLARSLRLKGDHQQAIDLLRRAVVIAPNLERTHRELGNALLASGQSAEAIEQFGAAIRISPSTSAYLEKSRAHENLKQYEAALESANKAKEIDSKNPEPYARAGLIYHEDLRDFESAYRQFRRAASLAPDDVSLQANFAEACLTVARFDEAFRAATGLLHTDPTTEALSGDDRLAIEFVAIAALQLQGRREEARAAQTSLAAHMKHRAGGKSGWNFSGTRLFLGKHAMNSADRMFLLRLLDLVEQAEYAPA